MIGQSKPRSSWKPEYVPACNQNPEITAILFDTGTRIFQERNHFDSYCGIGLLITAATERDDYSHMKGNNVIGNILEVVKDYLILH